MKTLTSNQLDEVMNLFTSKNEEIREWMNRPFYNNGYLCATNGRILIRTPFDNSENKFDINEKCGVEKVFPEVNCNFKIEVNKETFLQYKVEDETEYIGEELMCGHCEGEGEMSEDYRYKGKTYTATFDCPVCDGTGFEESPTLVKTGGKTFMSDHKVKINGVLIKPIYFEKLITISEMTNEEIVCISCSEPHKAVSFKIGLFEILIMPIMEQEDDEVIIEINNK